MRRIGKSSDGEVAGALRRGAVGPVGSAAAKVAGRPLLRVVMGGRAGASIPYGWRRRRAASGPRSGGLAGSRVSGIAGAPAASGPEGTPADNEDASLASPRDPDAGMSTVEYAVGTVVAAAFAAVLYRIVTGDSIVSGLQELIDSALHTVS